MFTDARFMTARQKDRVLKDWRKFLRHGLKKQDFTKRLYEHLHLHCGFIAHYNLQGFYATYFEAGQDTERFFEAFCVHRTVAEHEDLNTAMREEYAACQDEIARQAEGDIARGIELLDACVSRTKRDPCFARQLLQRISL